MKLPRFFRRKYEPPHGDGTPSGNWSRGDLAVCTVSIAWTTLDTGEPSKCPPGKGDVYRVMDVCFWNGIQMLQLEGYQAHHWHTAVSFRKAVTDKREACETEFVTLLQQIKRKQTVPASCDTRPKGGDSTEIEAPFTGGAVPKADAQRPPQ